MTSFQEKPDAREAFQKRRTKSKPSQWAGLRKKSPRFSTSVYSWAGRVTWIGALCPHWGPLVPPGLYYARPGAKLWPRPGSREEEAGKRALLIKCLGSIILFRSLPWRFGSLGTSRTISLEASENKTIDLNPHIPSNPLQERADLKYCRPSSRGQGEGGKALPSDLHRQTRMANSCGQSLLSPDSRLTRSPLLHVARLPEIEPKVPDPGGPEQVTSG